MFSRLRLPDVAANMKKITWNSDKVLSISAFIISIATLLTLLYQVRLAQDQVELVRKEQKASVLPYIEIWSNSNMGFANLYLANNGIGPAFIEEISILFDNEVYRGDPASFYYDVVQQEDTIRILFATIKTGRVIPAGEKIEMIETTDSQKDADLLKKWYGYEGKVKVRIRYSSVYDDQWVTEGIGSIPTPLEMEEE